MKIETERLYIRHFVNEDASICFEGWGTDEHLGDFIMGYPMNMDQMNSFVNAMVKNTNAWVIVEKESGACITVPNMFSATKGAKWGRKRSDGVEYVIDIAV